ncbi:MAG: hypothetical protein U1F39_14915 [Steroidobacteraceae bacterium]
MDLRQLFLELEGERLKPWRKLVPESRAGTRISAADDLKMTEWS